MVIILLWLYVHVLYIITKVSMIVRTYRGLGAKLQRVQ